ncbi:S-protein homolog 2-like [Hibiscus syriacus]|uniref:S-protein homolog 2-like n=1 Tax=Hibiscus syriacus TaxID=106335 RepID=UPI0019213DC7|nr:S-protein homolog 2-like [Hibiscus syriacus]
MNPWAIRLLWLLSATLVFVAGRSRNGFIDPYEKVIIYNDLEERQDLTIHCKSKDDDLGVHVLSYGESYDFEFIPRLFGRTLFFCRMTFNGKSHWFDVYEGYRDGEANFGCQETDNCEWNLVSATKFTSAGVCMSIVFYL